MTTRPVQVKVSQATRLLGSSRRQASRMASEIWSAILSGCPSVTDSEVKRKRLIDGKWISSGGFQSLLASLRPTRKAYGAIGSEPQFGLIFIKIKPGLCALIFFKT